MNSKAIDVIRKIKAGEKISYSDRVNLYNDTSVKLHLDKDTLDLKGIPIHVEHDTSNKAVGKILESWVGASANGKNPQLMVLGEVWDQNAKGSIDSGQLRGLSVGYGVVINEPTAKTFDLSVNSRTIKEVSLCKEPFFSGCQIDITASKKAKQQVTPIIIKGKIK
jgi:hypothetical protein